MFENEPQKDIGLVKNKKSVISNDPRMVLSIRRHLYLRKKKIEMKHEISPLAAAVLKNTVQ